MTYQEFKDTYFDGDDHLAMHQLSKEAYADDYRLTENYDNLKEILDSMDTPTADYYMVHYFNKEVEKHPDALRLAAKYAQLGVSLGLNGDEANTIEKNPFTVKFLGFTVAFILALCALLICFPNGIENEILRYILLLPLMFLLIQAVQNLIKLFQFKRFKKIRACYKRNTRELQSIIWEDSEDSSET